jgi:hypothetical protein
MPHQIVLASWDQMEFLQASPVSEVSALLVELTVRDSAEPLAGDLEAAWVGVVAQQSSEPSARAQR